MFHLCAHLSPGEEAANTSDQASPTRGSGTGGERGKTHTTSSPTRAVVNVGKQQEYLKESE